MAYSASATVESLLSTVLNEVGVLLPPNFLKTIERAVKELNYFMTFVEGLDSRSRERMKASLQRTAEAIRNLGAELFRGETSADEEELKNSKTCRDIHTLIETVKQMKEDVMCYDDKAGGSSSRVVSKSDMVGLHNQRRSLKQKLLNLRMTSPVFVLSGIAGIGKTTLAREMFQDLDVLDSFDCCVWVTVGYHDWKFEEITRAILAQVDPEMLVGGGYEEEVGRLHLKQSMKSKKYLVVLNDVSNENVLDYLKTSLPDNRDGSRVLLTTRKKFIDHNDVYYALLFPMRFMNEEESWHLLRDRVFGGKWFPPQLVKHGKMIAKKCDGLPLTIVTVADLLSMVEDDQDSEDDEDTQESFWATQESFWADVATQRKHQVFVEAYDQISEVLFPDYNQLRDEFKLCFLYMGVFPANYAILWSKLINLWIVEEVCEPSINLSSVSHMIECMRFLDSNSLVMIHQTNFTVFQSELMVTIKSCGIHSSWWHFCQIEARRTTFFYVLECYDDGFKEGIQNQIRLSIHNNVLFALKDVHNSIEENCASTAQSLLCFGPYNQYMVPICLGLKLLKRLHALNVRFYEFPTQVLELVKLTYLALTCNRKLPQSISKLEELEYLIVCPHMSIKHCGALSYLPMEIWDMKRLKYLDIMGCDLPDLGNASLQNLMKLSNVTSSSCIVLKRAPNLKKLGIKIALTEERLVCFDHISNLIALESLKCVIVNPGRRIEVALFQCLPFSLKKVSLSGMGYPWEEMSKLALLPNLQILKLRCNAFRGPKWKVEEDGFQNLYSLVIEDVDLVKGKWKCGSFKLLRSISIKHCYKLEKLQFAPGSLPNISSFQVLECNPLLEVVIKRKFAVSEDGPPSEFLVKYSWK